MGPVESIQGDGFLLGLRTSRPARGIVDELLEKGILAGTQRRSQHRPRCCRRWSWRSPTSTLLAAALAEIRALNGFLDLADLAARGGVGAARARRPAGAPARSREALAGKVLALLFFNPSLRTLASFQAGMSRLGGSSFVISPGQGSWQLETRDGRGDGRRRRRARARGDPGAGRLCATRWASAPSPAARDLAADLADATFRRWRRSARCR